MPNLRMATSMVECGTCEARPPRSLPLAPNPLLNLTLHLAHTLLRRLRAPRPLRREIISSRSPKQNDRCADAAQRRERCAEEGDSGSRLWETGATRFPLYRRSWNWDSERASGDQNDHLHAMQSRAATDWCASVAASGWTYVPDDAVARRVAKLPLNVSSLRIAGAGQ
jgi:hypothetical protein